MNEVKLERVLNGWNEAAAPAVSLSYVKTKSLFLVLKFTAYSTSR